MQLCLIAIKDLNTDIKKTVGWGSKAEGLIGKTLDEAKPLKLTKDSTKVIFVYHSGFLEISAIADTFKVGQLRCCKGSGHKGVNQRFSLICEGLDQDEDENCHARGLGAETVFTLKIKKITLMHLEVKTKMLKKILVRIEMLSESLVEFSVCSAQVATTTEDIKDLTEMGEIIGVGFSHYNFSNRMGRATRVASSRR